MAQGGFSFFLLISDQRKGLRLRSRVLQIQTPSVPVRKGNTALVRSARDVLNTHPVALALELSRWVSGLPGKQLYGWKKRAGVEQLALAPRS